jgi:hypothetical protein
MVNPPLDSSSCQNKRITPISQNQTTSSTVSAISGHWQLVLGGTVCLFEQFLAYTLRRIVNLHAKCYIVVFGFFLRPYSFKMQLTELPGSSFGAALMLL